MRFDWAIKTILRDKANFDIIEGFLTALFKEDIYIEEILESEGNQFEKLKFNRVDLLVKDIKNNRFIIEIQNESESDYLERLLFGTSKTIVENLELGEAYRNLKKVISISIMYFNFGTGQDYMYYGNTEFIGVHTGEKLVVKELVEKFNEKNEITRSFIEKKNLFPEYYLIEVERFNDIINADIDEWVYFLRYEQIKDDFKSKNIQKAKDKLSLLKLSVEKRKQYERYLMSLASEKDTIETIRGEGLEEGMKIGKEEGVKIGKEEGVKIGKEEEKIGIAKNMLKQGSDIDFIVSVTGLSFEVVERLK